MMTLWLESGPWQLRFLESSARPEGQPWIRGAEGQGGGGGDLHAASVIRMDGGDGFVVRVTECAGSPQLR